MTSYIGIFRQQLGLLPVFGHTYPVSSSTSYSTAFISSIPLLAHQRLYIPANLQTAKMTSTIQHRPRSHTAIYQPEAMFNVPTQERQSLLSELKTLTGKEKVAASFWACLYICDLSKLRQIIETARAGSPQAYLHLLEVGSTSLPINWLQIDSDSSSNSTSSSCTESQEHTEAVTSRKHAEERDGYRCVFMRTALHDVAQIYPTQLVPQTSVSVGLNMFPDFWKLLEFFFDKDRIARWRRQIFRDLSDANKPMDSCRNRVCLDPVAHCMWNRGLFALRPIAQSEDNKELTIQFHWQPKPPHMRFDEVDILQVPASSRDLDGREGLVLHRLLSNDEGVLEQQIKSGDVFVLKTENPATHPLPSFDLLDMHWHLNRILNLSGASGMLDEVGLDNGDYNMESGSSIDSWISSTLVLDD